MAQDNAMEYPNAYARFPLATSAARGNSLPANQYSSGAFYCHFEQSLRCNNNGAGVNEQKQQTPHQRGHGGDGQYNLVGCLRLASAGLDGTSSCPSTAPTTGSRGDRSRSLYYSIVATRRVGQLASMACGFMPGLPASMARRYFFSCPAGLHQRCDCSFQTAGRWPFSSWRRRLSRSAWSRTSAK